MFLFRNHIFDNLLALLLGMLLLSPIVASTQTKKIELIFTDTILSKKSLSEIRSSSVNETAFSGINTVAKAIRQQLIKQSFLAAQLDSIVADSSSFKFYYQLGNKITWAKISANAIDEEVLSKVGFRDKLYNKRPFNQNQLQRLYVKVVSFYENHGYPFASIQLDSVVIKDHQLYGKIGINKGQLYKIDSVVVKGSATVSDDYIKNYIRINDGDIYNEDAIKKLSTRLKEIPFVAEDQPPRIFFNDKSAHVQLLLKKKQANRFNGILGIVPDEDGKIRFNGDVKLLLLNSFKRGEEIAFNWRAMQNNSQDLKLNAAYPFMFNSPFGAEYQLNIYKRDSTYIDVFNKIGMRYILKGNNYFSVFYENKNSSLLSQSNFANLTVLPDFADVNTQLYGIGILFHQLDYINNPRKGFSINANGALGNKKIKKNAQINEEVYDGINLNTNLYTAKADIAFYIPVRKRSVIKLATQNGFTYNENLFDNELFRIGGFHLLRGFDEESIFASFYTVQTLEYRFILEQNSYLYLFTDAAFYEYETSKKYIVDRPYSFGLGMNFETNAGIFSLSYAIGKQFDNPVQFRSAKIHFGFINYF